MTVLTPKIRIHRFGAETKLDARSATDAACSRSCMASIGLCRLQQASSRSATGRVLRIQSRNQAPRQLVLLARTACLLPAAPTIALLRPMQKPHRVQPIRLAPNQFFTLPSYPRQPPVVTAPLLLITLTHQTLFHCHRNLSLLFSLSIVQVWYTWCMFVWVLGLGLGKYLVTAHALSEDRNPPHVSSLRSFDQCMQIKTMTNDSIQSALDICQIIECFALNVYNHHAAAKSSLPPPSSIMPADWLTLSLQLARRVLMPPICCLSSTRGCTQLTLNVWAT